MSGVVAAGNAGTAEAALRSFAGGGNAVDAAVAAALASFVCEPLLASAGGGGLLICAQAGQPPRCLDFFPRTPGLGLSNSVQRDFVGIDVDFGAARQVFHVGRASAAVPTVLPALAMAVQELGQRPLAEAAAPAIEAARRGVAPGASGAEVFRLLWSIVSRDPDTRALLAGGESPPSSTTKIQNPDFAALLEAWAAKGETPPTFTRALLESFGPERGGSISAGDLHVAAPSWSAPRELEFEKWKVFTSPHAGGKSITSMLAHMRGQSLEDEVALALALAAAGVQAEADKRGLTVPGSTTHISTLDEQGNVASLTLTNGEGSGHLVPGFGVHMNNFMGEEDLNPEGWFQHMPGDPLPTMMAPTLARRNDGACLALGSGGANRIRSAVTRALHASFAGMSVGEAVLAPRVHAEGDVVWFERQGWQNPNAIELALRERFSQVHPFDTRAFFFGGVHAAGREGTDVFAAGDPRRAGVWRGL